MSSRRSRSKVFLLVAYTLLVAFYIIPESPQIGTKGSEKYTFNREGSWNSKEKSKYENKIKHHNKTPLVLLFNTYPEFWTWTSRLRSIGNSSLLHLGGCPHRCDYTTNGTLYEETANLVVVPTHWFRDPNDPITSDIVKARQDKTGQIWLAVNQEAPLQRKGVESLDGVYNWISTYRRDSDIHWPYGRFVKRKSTKSKFAVRIRRPKLASWLVSHCKTNSMRRLLVRNLQQFIPIDVYGKCQELKCAENQNCWAFLGRTYKFYMAFENSLCLDYVTEKAFKAYKFNLVPVIYAWLNDSTILPPGSYINALDFSTPKDLAEYLRYLDTHEEEYLKFFEWKRNYRLEELYCDHMLCQACAKLHRHLGLDEGQVQRRSSLLGWLNSWKTNSSTALKFKFGQNILNMGDKVCVDASKTPDLLAWLNA